MNRIFLVSNAVVALKSPRRFALLALLLTAVLCWSGCGAPTEEPAEQPSADATGEAVEPEEQSPDSATPEGEPAPATDESSQAGELPDIDDSGVLPGVSPSEVADMPPVSEQPPMVFPGEPMLERTDPVEMAAEPSTEAAAMDGQPVDEGVAAPPPAWRPAGLPFGSHMGAAPTTPDEEAPVIETPVMETPGAVVPAEIAPETTSDQVTPPADVTLQAPPTSPFGTDEEAASTTVTPWETLPPANTIPATEAEQDAAIADPSDSTTLVPPAAEGAPAVGDSAVGDSTVDWSPNAPVTPPVVPGANLLAMDDMATDGMQSPGATYQGSADALIVPATEEKPPFDPIKENGPIFVGWRKPDLALLITGNQNGYLEPCGCAGLDRMKGGLSRRISLVKDLEAKDWPVVSLDVGGLIKGFGRQAELKFQTTVLAMEQHMNYKAIAPGKSDLKLQPNVLLAQMAAVSEEEPPFLSANVGLLDFSYGLMPTHRVIEENGWKIGVTSILGDKARQEINGNAQVPTLPADQQLQKVLPELKKQECDVLVLLAHAELKEAKKLAETFPDFKIVVASGGGYEPPQQVQVLDNGTIFIEVGEKGMNAVVLGLYRDPFEAMYQRVPLDSRFATSNIGTLLMQDYQDQLKEDGFEKLGIRRSIPHPQRATNGGFVGTKKCAVCHEPSHDVWKKSGHADAWHTLQTLEVPRTHDPECISCHAVGWHGTNYFPYETGFWDEQDTPHLIDVGCESCHGPGENHVKAEEANDPDERKRMREAMVLTLEEAKETQCYSCHDLDNSPDFDFDTYWPKIQHSEDLD